MRIDCALLRGTTVDEHGSVTCEHEPFHHERWPSRRRRATAAASIVIAQVKRLTREHASPQLVRLPGILVDYVVVSARIRRCTR